MKVLFKLWPCALFCWFAFLLAACSSNPSGHKPSTGKTNELLVVVNNETLHKGHVGSVISEFFGQILTGLPQPEKTFDVAFIYEPGFGQMFKTHHNIFIVDINASFDKPVIETHSDLWAKPQRIIKMTVHDEATFFEEFEEKKESFMMYFNVNERRRAAQAFGSIEDLKIKKFITKKFDLNILIPKNFYVAKEQQNFVWIRREGQEFSQGILIYTIPYHDTSVFPDEIIKLRDRMTKDNVLGPSEGSFMRVSMVEPPESHRIEFNGMFAVEMRGMWELDGDFMGGPFINYTVLDEQNQRIVTVDGFVYYPNKDKKNLTRQLESLIYTLSFINPDQEKQ